MNVTSRCHLGSRHTADEERVACEYSFIATVLQVVANAVLGVARRVDALHRDAAQLEDLLMLGGLGNTIAVLATDDVELRCSQLRELV